MKIRNEQVDALCAYQLEGFVTRMVAHLRENFKIERLGTSAGILLLTDVDPGPLATHLADLFRISDEEDHRYYFRFYDPRVLRPFFPTCTAAEAREFFGPIDRVLVESEKTGGMCACQPAPSGVAVKENILGASAESRSPGERGR